MPAPKAENGFVAGENCFVADPDETVFRENLAISTDPEASRPP
jgi:hypothetical protein